MTVVGTIYNGGFQYEGGRFVPLPFVAVVSDADEDRVPRFMVSSDLLALRDRLQQFGLRRHPPSLFDPSRIIEVWF